MANLHHLLVHLLLCVLFLAIRSDFALAETMPELRGHKGKEPRGLAVVQENPSMVFRWPVRGRIVESFGAKTNGKENEGINISVPDGTPVRAAADGSVVYAGNELKGYGNLILLRHANGYVTAYAHLSDFRVKKGDTVERDQVIAASGQSGDVASPQLHFELRKGSSPVDPLPFLGKP